MKHCLKLCGLVERFSVNGFTNALSARTVGSYQIQPRDVTAAAVSSGMSCSIIADAGSGYCCSACSNGNTAACASTLSKTGQAASSNPGQRYHHHHQQQQQHRPWLRCINTIHQPPQLPPRAAAEAWQQQIHQRCLHTNTPTSRKWLPEYDVPDPEDEQEVILDEVEEFEAGEGEEFDSEWVDGGVVNTSSSYYTSDEDAYDVEFDEAWEDEEEVDDLRDSELSEDEH